VLCNIQHFSLHDGAGVRTTVFFKGCNLHCFWCHNPESQSFAPQPAFYAARCIGCGACVDACPHAQGGKTAFLSGNNTCVSCGKCRDVCYSGAMEIIGTDKSADAVMDEILRDRDLYAATGGGVTFSGGEPFLQPALLGELLRSCRDHGIPTAVESAACVPFTVIEPLLPLIDTLFCDVKSMDSQKHKAATGQPNDLILQTVTAAAANVKELIIRTPIIPGFNDTISDVGAIAAFVAALPGGPHHFELLPYRGICDAKYTALGIPFEAAGLSTPTDETMQSLCAAARQRGVDCTVNTSIV